MNPAAEKRTLQHDKPTAPGPDRLSKVSFYTHTTVPKQLKKRPIDEDTRYSQLAEQAIATYFQQNPKRRP